MKKGIAIAFVFLILTCSTVMGASPTVAVDWVLQPNDEFSVKRAYTPCTNFKLNFLSNKSIRLEEIQVGVSFYVGGQIDPSFKTEDYIKEIVLVADPSPGNNEAIENKIIASTSVSTGGGDVTLKVNRHHFKSGAQFTLAVVPKGSYVDNLRMSLFIVSMKCTRWTKKSGKEVMTITGLPFNWGAAQLVGCISQASRVKVTWTARGSQIQAFFIEAPDGDLIVEKVFIKSTDASTLLAIFPGDGNVYPCLGDMENRFISCDFSGIGIYIPAGKRVAFYAQNNWPLMSRKNVKRINILIRDVQGRRLVAQ